MKGRKLLVGVVAAVFGLSMTGLFSANADTERAATGTAYTVTANQTSGQKNKLRSTSAQILYSVHHNELL